MYETDVLTINSWLLLPVYILNTNTPKSIGQYDALSKNSWLQVSSSKVDWSCMWTLQEICHITE